MEPLTVREYRNNLASSFERAANGEQVLIRRRNDIYALVKVGREDIMLTSELQERIKKVEKACQKGDCVTCNSKDELHSFLDSL